MVHAQDKTLLERSLSACEHAIDTWCPGALTPFWLCLSYRNRPHDSIGGTNTQREGSPSGPSESLSSTESDNSRSVPPATHSAKSSRRRRDWSPDQTSGRNRKENDFAREMRWNGEHGASASSRCSGEDADDVHGTKTRNESRGRGREARRIKHYVDSLRREGVARAHRSGDQLENHDQRRGGSSTDSDQFSVDETKHRCRRYNMGARKNGRSCSLSSQNERGSGQVPSDFDVNERRSCDSFDSGESDQPSSGKSLRHDRRCRSKNNEKPPRPGGRRRRHRENSNYSHSDPDLPSLPGRKQASEQRRRNDCPAETDSHVGGVSHVDDNSSSDKLLGPRASSQSGRSNALASSPSVTSPCSSNAKEGQATEHKAQDSSAQPLQRLGGTPPGGVSLGKPIRGARRGEAIGMRSRVFDTTTIPTGTADLKDFVCSPLHSGPGSVVRCFIERNRSGTHTLSHTFSMYADLEDGSGRLLLAARKVLNP